MIRKNIKWWLSVTAIVLSMTVTITGCRPSPILEDIIYTEDAAEIEPDLESLEHTQDGEESIGSFDKVEEDAWNKSASDPEVVGKADADADTDSGSKNIEGAKNPDIEVKSDDKTGADVDLEQTEGGSGQGSGSGIEDDGEGSNGDVDPDEEDSEQPPENTQMGDDTPVPSKVNVPKKVVTDGNGEERQIPEDVFTVTAVGPAAAMVEMLGGEGRIVGSSESFIDNSLAKTMFSDIESIHNWWSGTGNSAISDEDFNELLHESPDVCFEISGQNTFTPEQITRLEELGIGYVPLKAFTSSSNIKEAVTLIADVLETNESNGKNAKAIASNYNKWVDDTLGEVKKACETSEFYALYVSDYREDISFSYESANSSIIPASAGNSGVATMETQKRETLYEMMKAAGIGQPLQGISETSINGNGGSAFGGRYDKAKELLIFPMWEDLGTITYYGDIENYNYPDHWEWYVNVFAYKDYNIAGNNSNWYVGRAALGTPRMPVLLAANEYVKEKIENDFYWQFYGYAVCSPRNEDTLEIWNKAAMEYPDRPWLYDPAYLTGEKKLPREGLADSVVYNYGGAYLGPEFVSVTVRDGSAAQKAYMPSGIYGEYEICVVPTGIDSWKEGCAETPLEAYWLANKISGTISDDMLLNRIRSFYKTFFGVTLSDDQLKKIIG